MTHRHFATRFFAVAAALLLVIDAGAAVAKPLSYMNCSQLWYARNAVYAENGYCFETSRAIRVFGRACFPPYGRLSAREQRQVNDIIHWEERKGCR